jgi:hypothetical protein
MVKSTVARGGVDASSAMTTAEAENENVWTDSDREGVPSPAPAESDEEGSEAGQSNLERLVLESRRYLRPSDIRIITWRRVGRDYAEAVHRSVRSISTPATPATSVADAKVTRRRRTPPRFGAVLPGAA